MQEHPIFFLPRRRVTGKPEILPRLKRRSDEVPCGFATEFLCVCHSRKFLLLFQTIEIELTKDRARVVIG
jgi:hypothetical protein